MATEEEGRGGGENEGNGSGEERSKRGTGTGIIDNEEDEASNGGRVGINRGGEAKSEVDDSEGSEGPK